MAAMAILGAGSWGTAIAMTLAKNGVQVNLFGQSVEALRSTRENTKYLPGHFLPDNIRVCTTLEESLQGVRDVMLVVPSHAFREVIVSVKHVLHKNVRLVWGTKGIEKDSNLLLEEVVLQELGDIPMAVLSGPSFAKEVAAGKPTAVCVASNNHAFFQDLLQLFHHAKFRVYESTDMIGVSVCGVMKNVFAIACGMSDGLGLGANARAAIMTRGIKEMLQLVQAMGGETQTVMGLAGVGDLVLTCSDDMSRNRRFGLAVGQGETPAAAKDLVGQAVEGYANVEQVYQLSVKQGLELPIVEQVYRVLYQSLPVQEAVENLLLRSPKSEF